MITLNNHHLDQVRTWNGISGLLNIQTFWGSMPQTPLETRASGDRFACLPPHKFLATAMPSIPDRRRQAQTSSSWVSPSAQRSSRTGPVPSCSRDCTSLIPRCTCAVSSTTAQQNRRSIYKLQTRHSQPSLRHTSYCELDSELASRATVQTTANLQTGIRNWPHYRSWATIMVKSVGAIPNSPLHTVRNGHELTPTFRGKGGMIATHNVNDSLEVKQ